MNISTKQNFYFQQLFEPESCTYTYLIADENTLEAAIIDTTDVMIERDRSLIKELGFQLKYVLDTHIHADHITAAGPLAKEFGAESIISQNAEGNAYQRKVKDGEEINLGNYCLKVIETPGHTNTCVSYFFHDRIFTGDALLIRGTGRTDFQQGDSAKLYASIHEKLFTLPDNTLVYPAHNYKGISHSTIGEEKKYNPRVGLHKTEAEYVQIMRELNLPDPKRIKEAVSANIKAGF